MNNHRLKIVFPLVSKAIDFVITKKIFSPNVVIATAMQAGRGEDVTLEEVEYILDLDIRQYIILQKLSDQEKQDETQNAKEEPVN